jgi:hypothetical protein
VRRARRGRGQPLVSYRRLLIALAPWIVPTVPLRAQDSTVRSTDALLPPNPRPRATAVRATERIVIDGRLGEAPWQRAARITDFRTVSPSINAPSAYATTARVLFTDDALIIGIEAADSLGDDGIRMQDLRRDFDRLENDWVQVVLDPLHDTRSSVSFQVTPYGSLRDLQAFDGGDQINADWDGVWKARTQRHATGWTAEIEIPWASLRYVRDGRPWGFNVARLARRTVETSGYVPWPRQFSPYRMTFAADLVGVEPPPPRANVRIRPFALGDVSRAPTSTRLGSPLGRVGGEILWAPTANTLVEVTANTDFAQADVDRQVVNLRRFSVFFPERRQFFLENVDVLSPSGLDGEYAVQPFFSRRIGLSDDGTLLPITGGGRVSWRTSRASAGALAIRQGETATSGASTFGVLRGSRFFTGATRLGAFVGVRDDAPFASAPGQRNVVTAIDGLTRFGETIQVNGMLSTSTIDDRTGVAATYFAGRDTPGLYTGIVGAVVTEEYAPRTGFVSRSNVVLTSPAIVGTVQPTWRPKSVVWFKPALISWLYHTPGSGALQEGYVQGYVDVFHTNGALWYPYVERHFQRPTRRFDLIEGVTIDAGVQDYWRFGFYASTDRSARWSLFGDASTGSFFDGSLDRVSATMRIAPSPRVALTTSYEINRLRTIGVRDTNVTTHLLVPELRVFVNPRLQFSSFYQYNTEIDRGTLNARVSWEFSPLSFFYLVYNDRRAIGTGVTPTTKQLVAKVVWLRQF